MLRWISRLTLLAPLLSPLLAGCASKWSYVDQDGDGVSVADGDCWDAVAGPPGTGLSGDQIFPGAAEAWYDGVDQDCAGDSDFDQDGDGFVPDAYADQADGLATGDCDDTAAQINPDAVDEFYDGVDTDCAGNDDFDQDGDGYVSDSDVGQATTYVEGSGDLPGGDCDDLQAGVNPAAVDDWYDGVDTDCAGNDDYDQDGDGYVPLKYDGLDTKYVDGSGDLPAGDCDDTDAGKVPDDSVAVVWYNGYDERCDENDGDQDGDGYWDMNYAEKVAASGTGYDPLSIPDGKDGDCFDDPADRPDSTDTTNELVPINGGSLLDPESIHPGADDDSYDGVDADCAGDSDFDKDGDSYDSECVVQRDGSSGSDCLDSDDPADCGDDDPAALGALGIYPGAIDTWYDGTDANCDNYDDWDQDYDHYIPDGYDGVYTGSFSAGDCDDLDGTVNPGESDSWYDGEDTDCSGNDDYDQDGDGYVPDAYAGLSTTYVSGSGSLPSNDCDDTDEGVNPSQSDSWYDGVDTNCSGNDDYDQDGDGYVPDAYAGLSTTYVSGSGSLPSNDCDDTDGGVNPAEPDSWYDGVDTNCSGNDDYDMDGDGYVPDAYAGLPTTYVSGSGGLPDNDCDDTVASVNPSGTDTWYDGVDTNCSGNDDYDQDGDGYVPTAYAGLGTTYVSGSGGLPDNDCDDTVASVNPSGTDTWYDGVDTNCSGNDDYDQDGDGYVPDAYAGLGTTYVSGSGGLPSNDCDDTDSSVSPAVTDTWYDGVDANCSGDDDYDQDGDGYVPDAYAGLGTTYVSGSGGLPSNDCDDADSSVNPAVADTWYDGVDANCSGDDDYDQDGDGYVPDAYAGLGTTYVSGSGGLPSNDCDDTDATVNPLGTDTWYDGIDTNCSGNDDYDQDSDGYVPDAYDGLTTTYVSGSGGLPAGDCDDTDATMNPSVADAAYDGIDMNCSGNDDYDQDSDGYVPDAYVGLVTDGVSGSGSLPGGDCDDTLSGVSPSATDIWYDGVDTNCSGNDDYDQDGDGYVLDVFAGLATTYVSGSGSLAPNDCDDTDSSVNPSATDTWYDGVDTNCSGNDDYDQDGDGYVSDAYFGLSTTYATGTGALPGGDCDDTASGVNPLATDSWYDGVDTDCAGNDDYDQDGDGYVRDADVGQSTTYVSASGALPGGDCDDTASGVYPSAMDTWYDGVDTDCGGDDDYDKDGDGYVQNADVGKTTTYVSGSGALPGGDCDDGSSSVNPAVTDIWYDGSDWDCAGNDDYDQDGDGYVLDADVGKVTTYVSGSGSLPGGDCNETDATINPGASEICDGIDNDCDSLVDDDDPGVSGTSTWYADADGDTYGDAAATAAACVLPSGYVTDVTDCDDTDPTVNPAALEVCGDAVDDDCDGSAAACRLAGTVDLSSADAKLVGELTSDYAGFSVSDAGDVDGDGYNDLLIGAYKEDSGGSAAGAAYVVLGPVSGTVGLSSADAKLVGELDSDYAGTSVSGAGDVDGDGYDDLLLGAPGEDLGGSAAGAAYLLFGPVSGTLNLSVADAKLVGETGSDRAGTSVSGAGDVDGDGYDDLLVGAYGEGSGGSSAGAAYLLLGPASGTVDLYYADAKLVGEAAGDNAGTSVSGAGDVDGDGYGDLLIGAAYSLGSGGSSAGAAYLLLGPVSGTVGLSSADAKLVGETAGDDAGVSVSSAGDVDGDGTDDLLIGAALEDSGGSSAGAAYLVLGPVSGTVDLSSADTKLVGEAAADYAGYSVSGAGDVDGDGYDDLLVGAYLEDSGGSGAGATYLLYGGI